MFKKHLKIRESFTWHTLNNNDLLLKDMDSKHIKNCINMLENLKVRAGYDSPSRVIKYFKTELKYRRWVKLNRILKEDEYLFESDKLFE